MSVGGISDAISQFELLQQRLQQLQDGSLLDSLIGGEAAPGGGGVTAGSASPAIGGASPASRSFAGALAQAQAADAGAYPPAVGGNAYTAGATATYAGGSPAASVGGGSPLPPSASTLLTSGQQQFASTLAADTGLDSGVVTAWLLAEESGSAAQARQSAGNNDWLNIGYTGSGTYGATDSIWSDPVSAANATSAWIQGQGSVAGYGTASPGIQAILQSVGQSPASQLAALQQSGWSSSGYPGLASLYGQVSA